MRIASICILVALVMALRPAPAAAHPEILRSDPPVGGVLESGPDLLTLTFTEPIEARLLDVTVVSESGARVDRGDAHRLDNARQIQVGLGVLAQGGHIVRWRALGLDAHVVAGAFSFGVGRPASDMGAMDVPASSPIPDALIRWVTLLAACVLVGGVLFRQLVLAPTARYRDTSLPFLPDRMEERVLSLVWGGFSGFLGASVVLVAAEALSASGDDGFSRLGEVILGSRFGQLWIARMAVLSALGVALAHLETPSVSAAASGRRPQEVARAQSDDVAVRAMAIARLGVRPSVAGTLVAEPPPPPPAWVGQTGMSWDNDSIGVRRDGLAAAEWSREQWWRIASVLGVALLLLFSLSGHPAVTEPIWLSVPMDWIHVTAAVVWIGGIFCVAVLRLTKETSRDLGWPLLRRFSVVAMVSVAALIASGLFAAWVFVPTPAEVTESRYGIVLLVKLALVAGTGALGLWHWGVAAGFVGTQRRLGSTLAGEVFLACAVLASVALLVNLPTAQGESAARQAMIAAPAAGRQPAGTDALTLAATAGHNFVTLTLEPARPGTTHLGIDVLDTAGKPVDDASVTVRTIQSGPIQPESEITASRQGPGRYAAEWQPKPGRWTLNVAIARPRESEAVGVFNVELPVSGARDILRRSDQAMNRLESMQEYQMLDDGEGNRLGATYTYIAPDRMRVADSSGVEIIAALGQRFERQNGRWQTGPWPDPRGFRWPTYAVAQLTTDYRLLSIEDLDGRPHFVVTFADGQGPRYTYWIDTETYLVRRERMLAPGHDMTATFSDFNSNISVEPPDLQP